MMYSDLKHYSTLLLIVTEPKSKIKLQSLSNITICIENVKNMSNYTINIADCLGS